MFCEGTVGRADEETPEARVDLFLETSVLVLQVIFILSFVSADSRSWFAFPPGFRRTGSCIPLQRGFSCGKLVGPGWKHIPIKPFSVCSC